MMSKYGLIDKFELYRISNGKWDLEVETCNKPSVFTKLMCKMGLKNIAGDALTNYAINDLAVYLHGKYSYTSVGTNVTGNSGSGTPGTDYTLTDLDTPVLTRVAATKSYESTYNTDPLYPDTTVYTSVMTSTGDYTLKEAGLHTTLTGGYLGARQVFSSWDITNGETFGTIWKIINSRG